MTPISTIYIDNLKWFTLRTFHYFLDTELLRADFAFSEEKINGHAMYCLRFMQSERLLCGDRHHLINARIRSLACNSKDAIAYPRSSIHYNNIKLSRDVLRSHHSRYLLRRFYSFRDAIILDKK